MQAIRFFFTVSIFFTCLVAGHAQPGAQIEVKKPKKYENRKLPSEKTGEKKFTVTRKLYQNTVTHYNYYFNANSRLNELLENAKTAFTEDYSQLLPFYNYTLTQTAQSKQELDSIVYKCTAGILLHDLRNSWIDNMYLLLAKAYFFRNDLDSAALTLQYLNYAYAPKEEGGYDKPIGSNASNEAGEFSIATREKNSIWTKLTSRPPSRNESFIWQIRNHIEKDELPDASGVIEILRHDPNFPKRLQTDLNEVMAYWFYKQQAFDSSAFYLSNALDEAQNNREKARWEYLIAQMYQLSGKNQEAVDYYGKSISHTTNPVMEVYARLNSIRINRGNKKDYLQENIDALLKMAGRDKYISYRDIIYYAAANIEMERHQFQNAEVDLLKSVQFTQNNPQQRTQSFLLLADINYDQKKYQEAYNYYDSADVTMLAKSEDKNRLTLRKPPLKIISGNIVTVTEQDSLQAIAKMSPEQVDAMIKKQIKLLRKSYGLKDEESPGYNPAVKQVPDLFAGNNKTTDFYFSNSAAKARGFSEFRARWGERPNVDNWRRKSLLDRQVQRMGNVEDVPITEAATAQKAADNSYEGMLQNIPTTPEKLDASNKKIMDALFSQGQTFMVKLEEYPPAILAFEELLRRFPNSSYNDEVLFNLVYAYEKTGDMAKSQQYKSQLMASPGSKFAKLIANPQADKNNSLATRATRKYEEIYNLFIEGNFSQAKEQKKSADSVYGKSYWTPQLLFIESIYYIKQKEDSTAIRVLTDLVSLYRENPMAPRAKTMIDVLRRRKEIEAYLTKLEVTRKEDKAITNNPTLFSSTKPEVKAVTPPPAPSVNKKDSLAANVSVPAPAKKDSVATTIPAPAKKDTVAASAAAVKKDTTAAVPLKRDSIAAPIVKKDSVIATPSVAASDTLATPPVTKDSAIVVAPVAPAPDTTAAPSLVKDTAVAAPPVVTRDTAAAPPAVLQDTAVIPPPVTVKADTSAAPLARKDTAAIAPAVVVKNFSFVAPDPHYVVVLLDKVDPVYASEARNAFNRFNQERYYNERIEVKGLKLNDRYNMVLEGPFANANAAVEYVEMVRPQAKGHILPWLSADKFSFLIISNANLEVLKADPDMDSYKKLLQKAVPGKF